MQQKFKNKFKTTSRRLQGYDYSSAGWYFVTICTKNKKPLFGEIRNGIVGLSEIGNRAFLNWQSIPTHHQRVQLDEFIVMPNHIHGLIGLKFDIDSQGRDVGSNVSTLNQKMSRISPKAGSLGAIIRSYKGSVTRWCTRNGIVNFSWQSNYYDHIVRTEQALNRIRKYIYNNPIRWDRDDYYIPSAKLKPD